MSLVLDASAALAWLFERSDRNEAARADRLLDAVASEATLVPCLWHHEVSTALLVAEPRGFAGEAGGTPFA